MASLPSNEPLGRASTGGGMFHLDDPMYMDESELEREHGLLGLDSPERRPKQRSQSSSSKKDKKAKDKKAAKKAKEAKKEKKDKKDKKSSGGNTTTTTTATASSFARKEESDDYEDEYDDDFIPSVSPAKAAPALRDPPTDDSYSERFESDNAAVDRLFVQQEHENEKERQRQADADLERKRKLWEAHHMSSKPEPEVARHTPAPAETQSSHVSHATTPTRGSERAFTPEALDEAPHEATTPIGDVRQTPIAFQQQHHHQHHHQHQGAPMEGTPQGEVPTYYREELEREKWRWNKEMLRRQRRALERKKQQILADEEIAASAVMKRLATDVKSIFQELNLSIVAAERDRHQKEERYRKEREARDRVYQEEREARDERDRRERLAAEERFWGNLEVQDKKRQEAESERALRDKRDQDERFSTDLEDKEKQALREREHRDNMDQLERDRRDQEDASFREREKAAFNHQLETYQRASRQQTDELQLKMQSEMDHMRQVRTIEMEHMETRHRDALAAQKQQYEQSTKIFDVHTVNADKLESLVLTLRDSVNGVGSLNDKANEAYAQTLLEREQHLTRLTQQQQEMQQQIERQRDDNDKERQRLQTLYTRFETAVASFTERHNEELRTLQEAQVRAHNLRDIVEEQRTKHAKSMNAEMLGLEQKRAELDEERFKWLQELQQQRMDLGRERSDLTKTLESVRKEERQLNDAKQLLNDRIGQTAEEAATAGEKQRYIEQEYRQLERYKEETTLALTEERRQVDEAKRQVELVMNKACEASQQAAELRNAAQHDRQQTEHNKRHCDDERRNMDLIRRKIDHDKQKLKTAAGDIHTHPQEISHDSSHSIDTERNSAYNINSTVPAPSARFLDPAAPDVVSSLNGPATHRKQPPQSQDSSRKPLSFLAQEQRAFLMSIQEDIVHD